MQNIDLRSSFLIAFGAVGGALAALFPVPLPFMLGAMAASGAVVGFAPAALLDGYKFPEVLRQPFIALIGLLIGAQVHLELLTDSWMILAVLTAVTGFVPLVHWLNYKMMRRLGGYDSPTAYFAAAPGGLLEAMLLGERAGAQIAILTVQQFLRIILVVTLVPFAMSLWVGHPVGSAAGLSHVTSGASSPLWQILAVGAAGYMLGKGLRLPAGQMTGPLLLAGALTATGWWPLSVPNWQFIAAQVVIGTSLGLRFNGLSGDVLRRGLTLGLASSAVMLALGGLLAFGLTRISAVQGSAAWLSLAPGGVTEMSLVALSLAADPALVTLAHVYRIALTVWLMSWGYRRFSRPPSPPG